MSDEPTSGVEAVVRSALEHVMSEALRCQKDGGFVDPYWLETAIRPAALRIRADLVAPAPTPLRFLMDRTQLREQIASKPDIHDTVEDILTDGLEQIVLTASSDEADRLSRCLETARATLGFAASARKRAALPTSGVEAVREAATEALDFIRGNFSLGVTGGRTNAGKLVDQLRAALATPAASPATEPDDLAVDRFAAAMKAKLAKKRAEGRGGWEDKDDCSNAFLSKLLREHVDKGDPVDVGNLAMMIHQRDERIC